MLLRAIDGLTDEEIAGTLDVSRDAVKQTWRSIYDHVIQVMPDLVDRGQMVAGEAGADRKSGVASSPMCATMRRSSGRITFAAAYLKRSTKGPPFRLGTYGGQVTPGGRPEGGGE